MRSIISIKLLLPRITLLLLCSNFAKAQIFPAPAEAYPKGTVTPILPANFTSGIKVNYVRTIIPTSPIINEGAIQATDFTQTRVKTEYMDGLGRLIQTVNHFASPSANDLVDIIKYDNMGRDAYHFLPYTKEEPTANDNGKFKLTAYSDQKIFYKNNLGYTADDYFYMQTNYEPSPLNRVIKTLPQGSSWVGKNRGTTVTENPLPAGANVRLFTIAYAPGSLPISTSVYATADLIVKTTTDEDGNFTEEYITKDNHVVLKTTGKTGNALKLQTYYVYDDFGLLRYVVSPKATLWLAANNWTLNTTIAAELCFSYAYDGRLRPIVKTTPGAGAEWMVYNLKDELIFSQTPTQRIKGEWVFNKYDVLGRLIQTGIYYNVSSQAVMQNYANTPYTGADPLLLYLFKDIYGNQSYVNTFTTAKVYTTNYYDNYSFTAKTYDASYMSGLPDGWNTFVSQETTNLLTGTKTVLMDTPTELLSINYYNDRGLLLQTQTQNHKGGWNIITNSYDFLGQLLGTYTELNNPAATDNAKIKTVETFYYDHAGRVTGTSHNLNELYLQFSNSNYNFDELGRLKNKNFSNQMVPTIKYDYNVRGWLTGINKDYCLTGAGSQTFGMELSYDYGYTKKYYNGSIAGMKWRNSGKSSELRSYGYAYDTYNRLTNADYTKQTGAINPTGGWSVGGSNFSASNMVYDENGNIQSMKHRGVNVAGQSIILDDLSYGYTANSNKLLSVTESVSAQSKSPTTYDNLGDFRDVPGANDYTYDANGNLLTDANKSLSFTYDEIINKTKRVSKGTQQVNYLYDASGNKLQKKVSGGSTSTTTDYIGAAVYINNSLSLINHSEGRIRYIPRPTNSDTKYLYDYYIKDHLGSTRSVITYTDGNIAGIAKSTSPTANEVKYIATSEPDLAAKENQLFDNVDNTRSVKPKNKTTTDNYVAKLNGKNSKTILGPDITLKVMAGDTVKISAEALYIAEKNNPKEVAKNVINNFITAFTSLPSMAAEGVNTLVTSSNQGLANAILNMQQTNATNGAPKAFLNYLLYDEYMNLIPEASGALQVKNKDDWQTLQTDKISIPQNGFIRVFSSNMETAPVSINNTTLVWTEGQLVEEYNYYPYGLVFNQSSASGVIKKTDYLYNGKELQHNEFGAGNGLELCDFDKRAYDSQTGRFNQTDILADQRNNLSPYNYCSNNPINRTDPTGMIDGWYNNENNQSTFDKNINSQADMTKAGINGTFIGQEALVVDNKDNTMKWGNSDGTLSGINLPEVAVSSGSGNDKTGEGLGYNSNVNDVINGLGAGGGVLDAAATLTVLQDARYAQRGLNLAADASSFAKLARGVGHMANSVSYLAGAYQIATKHDNTSTWVDMGVTTLGIGAGFIFGTAALPAIAVGGSIYGIWSIAGGGDWIDNKWGYRKP